MESAKRRMSTLDQPQSTCIMVIELGKASWLIGIVTPLADKVSLRKIPCGEVA